MKKKKKVRFYLNLGKAVKAQHKLYQSQQDVARFNRLYIDELIEGRKMTCRLKSEVAQASYYYDCMEFLFLSLLEARNLNKEGIEGKLKKYDEFRNECFANYMAKKGKLNKVEASAFGKYIVAYVDNETTLIQDLKEARTMLEKEKAFSCYLYDCKEVLITSLYDINSKCPQVDKIKEEFKKFDSAASKLFEEKIKTIQGYD